MAKRKRNKSGNPASGSVQAIPAAKPVASVAHSTYSVSGSTKSSGSFYTSTWFEWLTIAVVSGISFWLLTARLIGVSVSVLIDEYSYVLDSHYRALNEANYPNHLFQLVFSVTKECDAEFYSCARNLNAVFVIAGAIFFYLLAKHVSGKKWLGASAAIAAILGSFGTYTAYFMPEAIFNFLMIIFYWALIRFGKTDNLLAWAGFGTMLGIASLAKPHAFFVVPALVIFIFLWTRATKDKFWVSAISRIGSFGLALLASKLGIGYLIAGDRALNIFGSYGGAISTGESVAITLGTNTLLNVPGTAWGQSLMITMILGVAFPVAILGLLEIFKKNALVAEANRVRAVVGISMLNMMAVVAVFEAWQNLTTWMHTRYYSYLIPLAVIALIEAYSRSTAEPKPLLKRLVVGIFSVLGLVALFTAAIPYGANWIDAPDFRTHIDNPILSSIFIVLSIGLAIGWVWETKKVIAVSIAITVASFIFSGSYISTFLQNSFGNDSSFDHLGRVLSDYLPQEELDRTVLVGDSNTTMERALFSARTGAATAVLAPTTGFDISELDPGVMWVVRVGEPVVTGLGTATISGPGYSSVRPLTIRVGHAVRVQL